MADDSLKADREFVLEAVKEDSDALYSASEELQEDPELKKNGGIVKRFILFKIGSPSFSPRCFLLKIKSFNVLWFYQLTRSSSTFNWSAEVPMSVYEKFSKIIENRDADALIDCIAILD